MLHNTITLTQQDIILNNYQGSDRKLVNIAIKQYISAQKCLMEKPIFIDAMPSVKS